jgi:alpha-1,3-glucan synthase
VRYRSVFHASILIPEYLLCRLEKRKSIQLVAVGPVIDLHGRFAAEKFTRLMELYPGRVHSKPEFTALPPYLFSGADFALIPSRDEPFGLVAVEFGRKGALGVGSRLGGLGLMPGWVSTSWVHLSFLAQYCSQWYPVESSSASHLLSQLTKTIKLALKSTEEERAILRARSAVQRFPVIEWRQKMEDFHRRSITVSRNVAGTNAWRPSDSSSVVVAALANPDEWGPTPQELLSRPEWRYSSGSLQDSPTTPGSPGQWSQETLTPSGDQFLLPPRQLYGASQSSSTSEEGSVYSISSTDRPQVFDGFIERANRTISRDQRHTFDEFNPSRVLGPHSRASSVESIASILDEKQHSPLNKAPTSVSSSISLALLNPAHLCLFLVH